MGKKKRLRKLRFIKKAQLKAARRQGVAPPTPEIAPEEKAKAKATKPSKKRSTKKRSSEK